MTDHRRADQATRQCRAAVFLGIFVAMLGLGCASAEKPMRLDVSDGRCTRQADTPVVDGPCWIRVLSYNVSGLSPLLLGGMTTGDIYNRSTSLGWLARDYDLIVLQEDFEYTDKIMGGPEFASVEHGNGPRWGWITTPLRIITAPIRWIRPLRFSAPYGSGLTMAAPDMYRVERDDEGFIVPGDGVIAKQAFDDCEGWLNRGNDCFSTKGVVGMRLLLRNDLELDVWTTHLDAGDGPDDRKARRAQLRQIKKLIASFSKDRAVVLAGDFNADLLDEDEQRMLKEELTVPLELADSHVRARDNLWGTRVDYVFYRDGKETDLEVVASKSGEDLRFRHPRNRNNRRKALHYKNILSDHPALGLCLIVKGKEPEEADGAVVAEPEREPAAEPEAEVAEGPTVREVIEFVRANSEWDPTTVCRPD